MTSQGSLRAFRWPCWIGVLSLLAGVYAQEKKDGMYCGDENCYTVLGLERASFDASTVKKAYRKLSMQWHPDKNPDKKDEATEKFRVIATAYETLSSPDIKDAYDYYLDHPEMTMYNKMNFYRAAYSPKTPLWAVILGFIIVFSGIQYVNSGENAEQFLKSPMLAQMIEDEYFNNCKRGRWGYQNNELSPERKAEIKAAFIETLKENPECPLYFHQWHHTLGPNMVYWWPLRFWAWCKWRYENKDEIQEEEDRLAAEEAARLEVLRLEKEEKDRIEAIHQAEKDRKAGILAEKLAVEAAKKQKWLDEAAEEAEAEAAVIKEKKAERGLVVEGKVMSVDEMKKKGHLLVEVAYEDGQERVQIVVVDKEVSEGARVKVALEGAEVPGKKGVVKRSKVGGEWSEGELLEILAAVSDEPAAAPQAEAGEEEGVKQRKTKTKGKADQGS